MTSFTFTVPGLPVPQPRARVVARKKAHGYYPERPLTSKRLSYPDYKEWIVANYLNAGGKVAHGYDSGSLYHLAIKAYLPAKYCCDMDKVIGSFMDALSSVLWLDDKQVWKGEWERAVSDDSPLIEVTVSRFGYSER